MESLREVLGCIYVALAQAAGGDDLLRDANTILSDAVSAGAIGDQYARSAIIALVRDSTPDVGNAISKSVRH